MFENSLIGLQDVPTGIEGVNLARRLTNPGAKLTLVRVHGGYRVVASSVNNSRANAERGLAESDLNRTARAVSVTGGMAIGATSAADGYAKAIEETHADLLVLSAAQVLSPSDNLLAALPQMAAPVAITSFYNGAETRPILNIGVAHDSSAESDRALTVARRLAGAQGASLTGFQVGARQGMGGNQAAARAGEELAAFAGTVDLLVIGPRPNRPLRRLLGPSTIADVISASPVPVLLVPAHASVPPPSLAPTTEDWVTVERSGTAAGALLR